MGFRSLGNMMQYTQLDSQLTCHVCYACYYSILWSFWSFFFSSSFTIMLSYISFPISMHLPIKFDEQTNSITKTRTIESIERTVSFQIEMKRYNWPTIRGWIGFAFLFTLTIKWLPLESNRVCWWQLVIFSRKNWNFHSNKIENIACPKQSTKMSTLYRH